jgi:hypothetical protein
MIETICMQILRKCLSTFFIATRGAECSGSDSCCFQALTSLYGLEERREGERREGEKAKKTRRKKDR